MKKWLKIMLCIIVGIILIFIIDLLCIFTINRPILAIKENNGDSANLIYRGIFYDTYNCIEYPMSQIKFKGTKFNCAVNIKNNTFKETDVENVSIDIYDISLTGATIVIKDTNDIPYIYEEWYKLEKEVDGEWVEVKTIIDNYGFNEIAHEVDKNNEVKFVIDWEWLYGEISHGSYRIIKSVNNQYISIEFGIAET